MTLRGWYPRNWYNALEPCRGLDHAVFDAALLEARGPRDVVPEQLLILSARVLRMYQLEALRAKRRNG